VRKLNNQSCLTFIRFKKLKKQLHKIDEFQKQINAQKSLQPALWATIQEKLRINWTYDSNALEGSTLTRGETLFASSDTTNYFRGFKI
jgi:hypothetical protein